MTRTLVSNRKQRYTCGLHEWEPDVEVSDHYEYIEVVDSKRLYRQSVALSNQGRLFGNIARVVDYNKTQYEESLGDTGAWEASYSSNVDVSVRTFTKFVADAKDSVLQRLAGELSQVVSSDKIRVLIGLIAPEHSAMNATDSFIDHAQRLASKGQIDAALDLVYDQVDEMMLASKFDELNQVIDALDTDGLSLDIILGVLTITLPAKSKLTARAKFFDAAKQTLMIREEYREGLLNGLN